MSRASLILTGNNVATQLNNAAASRIGVLNGAHVIASPQWRRSCGAIARRQPLWRQRNVALLSSRSILNNAHRNDIFIAISVITSSSSQQPWRRSSMA